MNLWKSIKNAFTLNIDDGEERIDKVVEASNKTLQEIQQLRQTLPAVLANPEQVNNVFALLQGLSSMRTAEALLSMRNSHSQPEASYWATQWLMASMDMRILAFIEAANANQLRIRSEFSNLLDALKSETITKQELANRLEAIRKELAIPESDKKNIEWVRKYLEHSSKVAGGGDEQ